MMCILARRIVLLGCVAIAGLAYAPRVQAQSMIVSGKSLDVLFDDAEYLLKQAAPKEAQAPALEMLNQVRGPQAFPGFDRKRPFGAWVTIPANEGEPPSVAAAIPISNLEQAIETLKNFGIGVEANPGVPGFTHAVTLPDGNTKLFLVATKEYLFASLVPVDAGALSSKKPSDWMPRHSGAGDLSLTLRFDTLPTWFQKTMLDGVEQNLSTQRERQPGENDATYQGRIAGMDLVLTGFKSLVTQGADLSFDVGVDKQKGELVLQLTTSARPGTGMESTLKRFGERRSLFGAWSGEGPLTAWLNVPLPKEFQKLMGDSFDNSRDQAMSKIEDAKQKELTTKLLDLMRPVITADTLDASFDLLGPIKASSGAKYVMLGGIKVPNGKQIDATFRDMIKEIPKEEAVDVSIDFAKGADGTSIHKIKTPNTDPQSKMLLGEASVFFAIRDDAVMIAIGEEGQDVLSKSLSKVGKSSSGRESAAVNLVANTRQLVEVASLADPNVGAKLNDLLKDAPEGQDTVQLTLGAPDGVLRLRLAVGTSAIRILSVLGMQSQAAGLPVPNQ